MGTIVHSVTRGDRFAHPECSGSAKVMAVIDGYVMLRFPRCVPFVVHMKDLKRTWQLVKSSV